MPSQTLLAGQEGQSFSFGDDGATVANAGPSIVYHSDQPGVSSTSNDGQIAAGGSVTLYGQQWLYVDRAGNGGVRADLEITPLPAAGAGALAASMAVRPWAAAPTITKFVDATNSQFGITWTAEPDILKWHGSYYVVADVNTSGGTTEGASGQVIGLFTTTDLVTWTFVGKPFSDSALCDNPVTDAAAHFQPSLLAPQGDSGPLECYWANGKLYLSTLTSPGGKWHNRRFWWTSSNTPVLGETVNGNTAGAVAPDDPAWGFRPTIDGHTYDVGMTFFSRPLVLKSGRTLSPTIGRSSDLDAAVPATESTFTKQTKSMFCLLRDGSTWSRSEPVPCGSTSTPGGLWESFAIQADSGDIRLFGLNKTGTVAAKSALWVSVSSDDGRTWSMTRDTELQVPTQRHMAIRSTAGRFWMIASDMPATNSTGTLVSPSTNSSTSRYNMSAFVGRRGLDDFVPGAKISDQELTAQYGQIIDDGSNLVAVWHRDHADGTPHGRDLMLTVVAQPTDATIAYAYPRHQSERSPHGPDLRTTAPTGWHFDGTRQATATTALGTVTGLALSSWCSPVAGTTDAQVLVDVRDSTGARAGAVLRPDGLAVRSIVVRHGLSITRGQACFVAGTIDFTARTVLVVAYQGGTWTEVTHTLQAINLGSNPSDGQTVTIDGTLYTYRATTALDPLSGLPTTPGDVLLGADVTTSSTNLVNVLNARSSSTWGSASVVGTQDVILKRADGADFTITTGTAPITVPGVLPATLCNANCTPRVGGKAQTSSTLPYFVGDLIDGQAWAKKLTTAELKSLANQHTADAGIALATVASASTPSGNPVAHIDSTSTASTWPDIALAASTCTVSGQVVTVTGEASASLELPYENNAVSIPVQLPDIADGDHVVIATFDTVAHSIELAVDRAAGVSTLSLGGRTVGTIADPTRVNLVRAVASDKSVTVGQVVVKRTAPGNVRCYLGCAFPSGRLAPPKRTLFDLSQATVANYTQATQLDDRVSMSLPVAAAGAMTDAQLDALLPTPQPPVAVITDTTTGQVLVRVGVVGALWTRLQANVSSDGSVGSQPKQYETLSSPDGTHYAKLCSLHTVALNDRIDLSMLVRTGGDSGAGVHGTGIFDVRLADNGGSVDATLQINELIPFETAAARINTSSFTLVTTVSDATNHLYTVELWVKLEDPNAVVLFVPLVQKYKPAGAGTGGGITFYQQTPNPRVTTLPSGTTAAATLQKAADTTYRRVIVVGNRVDASTVTGAATYDLAEQTVGTFSGSSGARGVFYFDPADFVPTGRTGKLRLRIVLITNATAPAMTFTFGLYPVTGSGGGAVTAVSATIGTVTTNSTVVFTTPAATGATTVDSGDFDVPAAGLYAIGFTSSGAMAANSSVQARAQLSVRSL